LQSRQRATLYETSPEIRRKLRASIFFRVHFWAMFINYLLLLFTYILPYLLAGGIVGAEEADGCGGEEDEDCELADDEAVENDGIGTIIMGTQFSLVGALLIYELVICCMLNRQLKFAGNDSFILAKALSATVRRITP
jgi:hypothetical protein